VPHYWDHVLWVWGYDSLDEFIEFADRVNLDGVVEEDHRAVLDRPRRGRPADPARIRAPLVRPGGGQPKRELRIFTAEEGATEHIGLDHLPHVSTFIADWVADTFAEAQRQPPLITAGVPVDMVKGSGRRYPATWNRVPRPRLQPIAATR
jgi:hypothetical protein